MARAELRGRTVALLGGDRRELELARTLHGLGATVTLAGFGQALQMLWQDGSQGSLPERVIASGNAIEAVAHADLVIAPVSGTDSEGRILRTLDQDSVLRLDEETFRAFRPRTALLVGRAANRVRALADTFGVQVIETAELDTLAWLNAVPTAEGAIMLAFSESTVTVAWSRSVVLGFGRCGKAIAARLAALGSAVVVAARRPQQRAEARALGLEAVSLDNLVESLRGADFIFNTIPALVLDARHVRAIQNPEALIVDIASAPGGTDFDECKNLGLKALLAPGLPGRVAPKTAGAILSEALVPVIVGLLPSQAD